VTRYELCTLFDAAYLPRTLALYRSLEEHAGDFLLRAFCMDHEAYRLLGELELPRAKPIPLQDLERHDPALLAVKPARAPIEYYWTSTPSICLYCLETEPELEAITYLDADLMFFSSPQPVYDELGDESVLIVPHRYAPPWAPDAETSGIYNVQFLTFRRDERGLEALRWWRERCLEWCYARVEDGKFGDQRYLDDWPARFSGVHVLEHRGAGLAPWNVERYRLEPGDPPKVDGLPLVFFHFHSLRLYQGLEPLARARLLPPPYHVTAGLAWRSGYPLPRRERKLVWEPYLRRVAGALAEVRGLDPSFSAGLVAESARRVAAVATRRALGRAQGLARRLEPDRIRLVRLRRHGRSWHSASVARQMAALSDVELRDPDSVAPYRTFLEAMTTLVADHPLPAPAKLLDFGCGTGQYSELLDRRFPGRFEYTGWDYAPAMVDAARARWPGREFAVRDVLAPDLDLDPFDVICAGALVDVVADWQRALDTLLGARAPYVLLHRQRIADGAPRIDVVRGYRGQKTHRVTLRREDVEAAAARHGRAIARSFAVEGDVESFLLVRDSAS
jgi:SAM-dependent methyltransferase